MSAAPLAGAAAGPLAAEGAAVIAAPLVPAGIAVGPLAAEGALLSAGPFAVGDVVFGVPLGAACRILISLKNASHGGDSSMR